jgi:hypothetical protein
MSIPVRLPRSAAALALCAACALCACRERRPPAGNLLAGRKPHAAVAIEHVQRINDGVTPVEGDHWRSELSAVFGSRRARVVYDLGRRVAIDAVFLQGDNNDRFSLAVSDDGVVYSELWHAEPTARPGMRARAVRGLGAHGRYLRLTARGGDRAVSAGELMVFGKAPTPWPPAVPRTRSDAPDAHAQLAALAFAAALALLLLLSDRRLPRAALPAGALLALGTGVHLALLLGRLWPPPGELLSLLRALLAAVAALVLVAATFARPRRGVPVAVLSALALIGMLCFYNFGRPWFWHSAERRPTPVHTFDMRVYFPLAKYFDELGFDGVYFASVAAYVHGERRKPDDVADVELRDLRDNRMVYAREVMDQIEAAPRRFAPARWEEFVADMRFFWRTMGRRDYLRTLGDHGGNATPAWLAVAHLLFHGAAATERGLTLAALLDPLLLLIAFVAIARSFGVRAMLVCAVVFGASDFPMFGSNWAGSTLRMDWMAAIALGACALRTGRPALGGALLAYAGLARAFPALALAFAALPALIAFGEARLTATGPTSLRELGRMLAGAAVCALALFALSSALFGVKPAWGGWLHKIELHADKPNTNHVGVRTVMSFDPKLTAARVLQPDLPEPWTRWQETQTATYERRALATAALRVLLCLLCVAACRGARPEQAALIGLLLIPVLFYPANYYLHCVFLLPLLGVGLTARARTFIECALLALCVAQFFTLPRPVDVQFFWQSVLLLCAIAALLVPLVFRKQSPAAADCCGFA